MHHIQARLVRAGIEGLVARVALLAGGSIIDLVAIAVAAALEGVEEAKPVADLVGGRLAAGQGVGADDAAVEVEVVAALGEAAGEVALTDDAGLAGDDLLGEVEVERLVVSDAQLLLHGQLVVGVGPIRVGRVVGLLVRELERGVAVGAVDDADLGLDVALLFGEGLGLRLLVRGGIAYADVGGVGRLGVVRGHDVGVDGNCRDGLGSADRVGSEALRNLGSLLLVGKILGSSELLGRRLHQAVGLVLEDRGGGGRRQSGDGKDGLEVHGNGNRVREGRCGVASRSQISLPLEMGRASLLIARPCCLLQRSSTYIAAITPTTTHFPARDWDGTAHSNFVSEKGVSKLMKLPLARIS